MKTGGPPDFGHGLATCENGVFSSSAVYEDQRGFLLQMHAFQASSQEMCIYWRGDLLSPKHPGELSFAWAGSEFSGVGQGCWSHQPQG